MKKKLPIRMLAMMLGCLLIFSSFGGSVLALSPSTPNYKSENFVYEIEGAGAKIIRIANPASVVTIPCFLDEYPVVDITTGGNDKTITAFQVEKNHLFFQSIDGVLYNRAGTQLIRVPRGWKGKLVVPEGVVKISASAALGCNGITAVTFPKSLREIGGGAFASCGGIGSVAFPENLRKIGDGAFYSCSSLADIRLPDGVKGIENNTFWGTAYYNDPAHWEKGILYLDHYLITGKDFYGKVCQIREGTRFIARNAFQGKIGMQEIIFPDSVEYIGNHAFESQLKKEVFQLPHKGIELESSSFGYKRRDWEIDGHMLEKPADISSGTYSVGRYAINTITRVDTIHIPASVGAVSSAPFTEDTVVYNFEVDPKNKEYTAVDGVLYTKDMKTLVCCPTGKETVKIPQGVTKIAPYAFYENKRITKVDFPSTLKEIGDHAFWLCEKLTQLNLPEGLTYVGELAFYGCEGLQKVTLSQKATIDYIELASGGVLEVPYETQYIPYQKSFQKGIIHLTDSSFALEYAKTLGISYKVIKEAPKPVVFDKPASSVSVSSAPALQKQEKPIAQKEETGVSEGLDDLAPVVSGEEQNLSSAETPVEVPADTPASVSEDSTPWIWVGIVLGAVAVLSGGIVPIVLKKRKK